MKRCARLLVAAAAALACCAAQAQPLPAPELINQFSLSLRPAMTLDDFLLLGRIAFDTADVDHDGAITPADLETATAIDGAMKRASRLSLILAADLDGDGVVTREEIEMFLADPRRRLAGSVDQIMRFDRNRDGRLDWPELLAWAESNPSQPVWFLTPPQYRAIMTLDEDHDGKTTWNEYRAAAEKFFQSVDADHDGRLSAEEIEANRQRTGFGPPAELLRALAPSEPKVACTTPPAPQGVKIVIFTGTRGQGISSVAVGSQDDTTHASAVTIEAGNEPIYLVLAAHGPMIWQFDGAVDRVAKAVLVSLQQTDATTIPVGASGLPKDVVAFGIGRDCASLISQLGATSRQSRQQGNQGNDAQHKRALDMFKRLVGAEPDAVIAADAIWKLSLPSGHVAPAEYHPDDTVDPSLSELVFKRSGKGDFTYVLAPGSRVVIGPADAGSSIVVHSPIPNPLDELRSDFARYYPAGVVRIDPAAVVANQPAATYDVLPGAAGLIQLMESGAIEKNDHGEFLVKRKIRYPAGLPGLIDAKFLILKGVPMPDGDPGRAMVASEDTGDLVCKGRCP
jgi:Ca2+-binding EF-hand superfamily protein